MCDVSKITNILLISGIITADDMLVISGSIITDNTDILLIIAVRTVSA